MKEAIAEFQCHYEKTRLWEGTKWLGVPFYKLPFDALILQEIIFEIQPDFIIETGTGKGGAAVFYASLCELMGHGRVITIDIARKYGFSEMWKLHPQLLDRITFLIGDSASGWALDDIQKRAGGKKNIVLLDSWHTKEHVLKEMYLYESLVPVGSYMIVEDSHVSGHPVDWEWGEGPFEAIQEFLSQTDNFIIDSSREKYIMTFNPSGYLKRVT